MRRDSLWARRVIAAHCLWSGVGFLVFGMNKEVYDTLTDKEKLMYDELHAFAKRYTERLDEVVDLLKSILAVGAE